MLRFSLLLVFLSGATGLIYQVTWQKYLSIMLGSHASAASIVLALFFLFLSLGYAVIGKYSFKLHRNHLGLYGVFEFLIGIYALYSPQLFRLIFEFYTQSKSSGDSAYMWGLLFSGLYIFIPTFLMGGTIPVLVQALSSNYDVSSKTHARIYSVNTLGAFLGCISAGFWLIENFGIEDTLFLTGWLNLLIGLLVFGIVIKSTNDFAGPKPMAMKVDVSSRDHLMLVGLAAISFLSGFYIFTLEKLIIKMSGLVYGSSTYTYSIVVGAFILAIGVGSLLLSVFEKRLGSKAFIVSIILSAVSLIALYFFIPQWPTAGFRIRVLFQPSLINFMPYWITNLNFSLLILLVPIGFLGTNLPFLFSLIKNENRYLAQMVGRLYSVNCLGATLGAIIGGYWLFKFLPADQIFKISIILLIFAGIIATWVLDISRSVRGVSTVILFSTFIITVLLPNWKTSSFVPGRYLFDSISQTATDLEELHKGTVIKDFLFAKFDPNTFTTVTSLNEKDRVLYVNGKPDAATTGDQTARAMAALTPIALSNRKVESIFIAGLGAGLSLAVATRFEEVKNVEVAEISETVVEALPYFKDFNFGLESRVNKYSIEVGDAYKVLMSKNKKYDLIICEPSNPWVSGVEKLFSTEFYQQIKGRLHSDGLFAQWFPLFSMDEETFLTILNTFSKEFKWVSVWMAGGSGAMTIIGSETELVPNFENVKKRFAQQSDIYKMFKVDSAETIYYQQILTPAQVKLLLLKVEDVNSVFAPVLEFKAGRGHFAKLSVDLNSLLNGKAVLPLPKELEREFWPFWYTQKLGFEKAAFDKASVVASNLQYHLLRQHLLLADSAAYKANVKPEEQKTLAEHLFLLGRAPAPVIKEDESFDDQVGKLASKVRQLNAIGFMPKLGQLVQFINSNCVTETCAKAKYAFLSWTASPEKWNKVFSHFERQKLNAEQIRLIDDEYLNVQKIYQTMGAY